MTTFNILECMKRYGVKQLIFVPNLAIYGELNKLLNEDTGSLFPTFFTELQNLAQKFRWIYQDSRKSRTVKNQFPKLK